MYEGTFDDTMLESAVVTVLLVPNVNGDECGVWDEAFGDDFLRKCG